MRCKIPSAYSQTSETNGHNHKDPDVTRYNSLVIRGIPAEEGGGEDGLTC
jgi:hypothetical protein